jgi:hypothetical protein
VLEAEATRTHHRAERVQVAPIVAIVGEHRGIAYQRYIGRRAVSDVAFDLSTQPGTVVASSAGTGD